MILKFLYFINNAANMNKTPALLLLLLPVFAFSQVTTKETAKGKALEYFTRGDNDIAYQHFAAADSFLHLAVKEKDNFIDAWVLIGQLNSQGMRNYPEAIRAYEKVKLLQANYMGDVDYNLGLCYMNTGDYAKAKTCFTAYLALPKIPAPSRMLADKMVIDCNFAEEAMKHPVDFKPINLGAGINTADDESMPSLTVDGKALYFTRHFGDGMYQDEDLFVSLNTSAGFAPANSVGAAINTEQYIEGAQNISPSGKYMFFTSVGRPDGTGSADIYISRKVGDQWERANNMGSPINTPAYETQPCISADGKDLYYAGIRATGKGGTDIWVSHLNPDGTWSQPQSVGDNINTMYDEMRPYIHPDGGTLYFSSRGHAGMGNFDVYMSKRAADGTWGVPVNLGYPINTAGDELGIYVTADGTRAYYASEQKDSYGQMDIYRFDMPANLRPGFTSYVKGIVFDAENRDPVSSSIQVYDLETGKLFTTFSSDKVNGNFLSSLPAGRNYAVEVMKDGYLFWSHNVSLKDVTEGTPVEVNIPLHRIKVGEAVVLNNIFFESEKYDLQSESNAELEVVAKMMSKNPSLKIEIGGHTDNTGSEEKNLLLSEARAKSVYSYLVKKDIDAARITYKGYASAKPVAANTTAEGKAKNRRTELVVTGI
jgi:outer membrane protein OmpA-like peptidoglycan-associated protein/Tfp pilus assembly protein PilF